MSRPQYHIEVSYGSWWHTVYTTYESKAKAQCMLDLVLETGAEARMTFTQGRWRWGVLWWKDVMEHSYFDPQVYHVV